MVAFNSELLPSYVVDLKHHHSQCELNFHLAMGLVQNCRSGMREWQFELPTPSYPLSVKIILLDSAPYTSTFKITQTCNEYSYLHLPILTVRLYHDVEMAEVVAWDNHKHWYPVYSYPNNKMYHRDEKLALNRFFGEWLVHCRKLGISSAGFVNPLP